MSNGNGDTPAELVANMEVHPDVRDQLGADQQTSAREAREPSPKLAGLIGDAERPGHRALYLDSGLRRRVEFRPEDVVAQRVIPVGKPPFSRTDALEVKLVPGAQVHFVRFNTPPRDADWDLATNIGATTSITLGGQCWTRSHECVDPVLSSMRRSCKCGREDDHWVGEPEL
jgi:hypothetical protein